MLFFNSIEEFEQAFQPGSAESLDEIIINVEHESKIKKLIDFLSGTRFKFKKIEIEGLNKKVTFDKQTLHALLHLPTNEFVIDKDLEQCFFKFKRDEKYYEIIELGLTIYDENEVIFLREFFYRKRTILEGLQLRFLGSVNEKLLPSLVGVLQENDKVRAIKFVNGNFSNQQIERIGSWLNTSETITSIGMVLCCLRLDSIEKLTKTVTKNRRINTLIFDHNYIDDNEFICLLEWTQKFPSLNYLSFQHNIIKLKSSLFFYQWLYERTVLQNKPLWLNLYGNQDITIENKKSVLNFCQGHAPNIFVNFVEHEYTAHQLFCKIDAALTQYSKLRHIEHLDVDQLRDQREFDEKFSAELAACLKAVDSVSCVELVCHPNAYSKAAVTDFLSALQKIDITGELNLKFLAIDEAIDKLLANLLSQKRGLRRLNLSFCYFSSLWKSELLSMLAEFPVQRLDFSNVSYLYNDEMTVIPLPAIVEIIRSNRHVKEICLTGLLARLSAQKQEFYLENIADALKANQALVSLVFDDPADKNDSPRKDELLDNIQLALIRNKFTLFKTNELERSLIPKPDLNHVAFVEFEQSIIRLIERGCLAAIAQYDEWILLRANSYLLNNKIGDATSLLRKISADSPIFGAANQMLATIYFTNSQMELDAKQAHLKQQLDDQDEVTMEDHWLMAALLHLFKAHKHGAPNLKKMAWAAINFLGNSDMRDEPDQLCKLKVLRKFLAMKKANDSQYSAASFIVNLQAMLQDEVIRVERAETDFIGLLIDFFDGYPQCQLFLERLSVINLPDFSEKDRENILFTLVSKLVDNYDFLKEVTEAYAKNHSMLFLFFFIKDLELIVETDCNVVREGIEARILLHPNHQEIIDNLLKVMVGNLIYSDKEFGICFSPNAIAWVAQFIVAVAHLFVAEDAAKKFSMLELITQQMFLCVKDAAKQVKQNGLTRFDQTNIFEIVKIAIVKFVTKEPEIGMRFFELLDLFKDPRLSFQEAGQLFLQTAVYFAQNAEKILATKSSLLPAHAYQLLEDIKQYLNGTGKILQEVVHTNTKFLAAAISTSNNFKSEFVPFLTRAMLSRFIEQETILDSLLTMLEKASFKSKPFRDCFNNVEELTGFLTVFYVNIKDHTVLILEAPKQFQFQLQQILVQELGKFMSKKTAASKRNAQYNNRHSIWRVKHNFNKISDQKPHLPSQPQQFASSNLQPPRLG